MLTTQNNPWVKDFPILAADENGNRLVYLDSAATTQHPQQVLDAVLHYYQKDNANPHRGVYELAMRATDAHEGARHRVARFFGAEDDEIVFTQNTTESLNLVAYSYGLHFLHEGDEIVISVAEQHSNLAAGGESNGCQARVPLPRPGRPPDRRGAGQKDHFQDQTGRHRHGVQRAGPACPGGRDRGTGPRSGRCGGAGLCPERPAHAR